MKKNDHALDHAFDRDRRQRLRRQRRRLPRCHADWGRAALWATPGEAFGPRPRRRWLGAKTTLVAFVGAQLLLGRDAHANEGQGGIDDLLRSLQTARAHVSQATQALDQQRREREKLQSDALSEARRWIAAAETILTDANHPLSRQIRAASELEARAVLLKRDQDEVILGGADMATVLLRAHRQSQTEQISGLGLDRMPFEVMSAPPEEVIERATRAQLLEALAETGASVAAKDEALREAIRLQERGELPAGRQQAFKRLVGPALDVDGPALRMLVEAQALPEIGFDHYFELRTNEGPLTTRDGRPIAVRAEHTNRGPGLRFRVGASEPSESHLATDAFAVSRVIDAPPLKVQEALVHLASAVQASAKTARDTSQERTRSVRESLSRNRPVLSRTRNP